MTMYEYPGLDELIAEAHEAKNKDVDRSYLAGLALELATIHTAVIEALEPLKEKLRQEAREELHEMGRTHGVVTIEGTYEEDDEDFQIPIKAKVVLGTVTVTLPPKVVKLVKGVDMDRLKKLPEGAFSLYFEETVTYKPKKDLPEVLKGRQATGLAGPGEVETVLSAVTYQEPTPRVGFKPTDSDSPLSTSNEMAEE